MPLESHVVAGSASLAEEAIKCIQDVPSLPILHSGIPVIDLTNESTDQKVLGTEDPCSDLPIQASAGVEEAEVHHCDSCHPAPNSKVSVVIPPIRCNSLFPTGLSGQMLDVPSDDELDTGESAEALLRAFQAKPAISHASKRINASTSIGMGDSDDGMQRSENYEQVAVDVDMLCATADDDCDKSIHAHANECIADEENKAADSDGTSMYVDSDPEGISDREYDRLSLDSPTAMEQRRQTGPQISPNTHRNVASRKETIMSRKRPSVRRRGISKRERPTSSRRSSKPQRIFESMSPGNVESRPSDEYPADDRTYKPEEDDLIDELKNQGLRWSEIYQRFDRRFPGRRTQGALQVRYSNHIRRKSVQSAILMSRFRAGC